MGLAMVASEPQPTATRVLIADDQPDVRLALQLLLKGEGYGTETADSPAAVLEAVARGGCELLLMDLNYARDTTSGAEGLELLGRVRALDPALRIVVMTAWGTIELAVEAMRRGAHDFVLKPWDNRGLVRTLRAQEALRADEARGAGAFERRDLTVARRVQSRLLPQEPPRLETLELAGCCRPAGPVGGDVYDFLDLGAGRAGFLLGDASGRGVSAALLMAHLQASLRSQAVQSWRDPAGVLRAVNGQFFSATAPEHFATLFFACYEEGSRRLRYVNCGHLPPLLLRADGTSARLGPTAPGLGLLQAWDGVERQAALAPGDLLLLFTDGVSEAENAAGEEFGEARLLEALRAGAGLPAPALLASILEALEAFAGSGLQDDVTLLVARGL
jgi:sigma-B regulation protein RsbU (phosphoserine phosphatase)